MPQSLQDRSLQNWPQAAKESSMVAFWKAAEVLAVGEAAAEVASMPGTAKATTMLHANILDAVALPTVILLKVLIDCPRFG